MSETQQTDSSWRLWRDASGQLAWQIGDAEPVKAVRVARSFPWTDPWCFISLRDPDGKELAMVRDLGDLDEDPRRLVEDELTRDEFVPVVREITDIEDEFGIMTWTIRTDRGPMKVHVKDNEDIRELPDGQIVVRDYSGMLLVIRQPDSLDEQSRSRLADYLG